MPFNGNEKINSQSMPQPAPTRAIRYRYPWNEIEVGEGFKFAPNIKTMSARVMCANNGREFNKVFRCYRGVDEVLYCIRIAALNRSLPAPAPIPAPLVTSKSAPAAAEVFGDFGAIGGKDMADNAKNVVDFDPSPSFKPYKTDDDVM